MSETRGLALLREGELPTVSIVVPLYNEEAVIDVLHRRLLALLDSIEESTEVVLVDDGSRDRTTEMIAAIARDDPRFGVLQLSRNFGHQIAITAGMDFARGSAVVIMDGDLQDPPEVVHELLARWREGYEIVYAVRRDRTGETAFKRATAAIFYRLFRWFSRVDAPPDVGDFRLVDRSALEVVRAMREQHRYVRGMFAWIGFRHTGVEYCRDARAGGESKYPLRKMLKFATDAVISFSAVPLRFALQLGFLVSTVSFIGGLVAIALKLAGASTIPGWVSLVVLMTFLGGIQLTVLGVMSEYIARIYEESQRRPLYIVRTLVNLPGMHPHSTRGPWIG